MPANNDGFQYKADQFLSLLTEEDRADAERHCLNRPTRTSIKTMFDDYRREYLERGVELPYVSQSAINTWFEQTIEIPTREVQRIRVMSTQLKGLRGEDMLDLATLWNLNFLEAAAPAFTDPERIASSKPEALMNSAIAALKEIRTLGTQLKDAEYKATPKALERSGAYRLAEILRNLWKDHRFETEANEFLNAALLQHDTEIGKP